MRSPDHPSPSKTAKPTTDQTNLEFFNNLMAEVTFKLSKAKNKDFEICGGVGSSVRSPEPREMRGEPGVASNQ